MRAEGYFIAPATAIIFYFLLGGTETLGAILAAAVSITLVIVLEHWGKKK